MSAGVTGVAAAASGSLLPGAAAVVLLVQPVQRVRDVGHRPPRRGIRVEHPADRIAEERATLRPRRAVGGDRGQHGDRVALLGEGRAALDGGVQRRAQRPDVVGRRRVPAPGQLRGEVRRGAGHQARLGEGRVAGGPRDAEVGDLRRVVVGHQDVAGLDVAVDGAPGVRGGEAVGDLRADPGRALRKQRPVLGHDLGEGPAGDVLHHQPDVVALLDRVVDRDHVAMVERRGRAGLAEGPGQVGRGLPRQVPDLLDGHRPTQPLVAAQPDAAHPSTAHLPLHAVAAGDDLRWHAAPLDDVTAVYSLPSREGRQAPASPGGSAGQGHSRGARGFPRLTGETRTCQGRHPLTGSGSP